MKRVFLIDFENVSDSGLEGFCELSEEDEVIVFYTPKAYKISIDVICNMQRSESHARLCFENVSGGNQALDLQMATYLGSILEDGIQYYIVSKDQGYAYVIDFWRNRKPNISVYLKKSIASSFRDDLTDEEETPANSESEAEKVKKQSIKASTEKQPKKGKEKIAIDKNALNTQIQQKLSKENLDNGIISQIASIAVKNCNAGKAGIYKEIIKKFGQKKGLDYYRRIKSIIK